MTVRKEAGSTVKKEEGEDSERSSPAIKKEEDLVNCRALWRHSSWEERKREGWNLEESSWQERSDNHDDDGKFGRIEEHVGQVCHDCAAARVDEVECHHHQSEADQAREDAGQEGMMKCGLKARKERQEQPDAGTTRWVVIEHSSKKEPLLEELRSRCPLFARSGPRHLCDQLCFYREYEPARAAVQLRETLLKEGGEESSLECWKVGLELQVSGACMDSAAHMSKGSDEGASQVNQEESQLGMELSEHGARVCVMNGTGTLPWRVCFEDQKGNRFSSIKSALRELLPKLQGKRVRVHSFSERGNESKKVKRNNPSSANTTSPHADRRATVKSPFFRKVSPCKAPHFMRKPLWVPPTSPYGLLEELLWEDPWRLLLGCMLLNQTHRREVDAVLFRLLQEYPDACAMSKADAGVIERLIHPCGKQKRRSINIVLMSDAFVNGAWRRPQDLPGVGQYGADAYDLFVTGEWKTCSPGDGALQMYKNFLLQQEHLGLLTGT